MRVRPEIPAIDTPTAHSPRLWNYFLGGKDHYVVDRQVGDLFRLLYPPIDDVARSSRAFLVRTVRHLATAGVRQFLDIGTGLPAAVNTHDVAQQVAPGARVVYVDNDPVVLAHARALLHGAADGTTAYVDGDLYNTGALLEAAGRTLAFEQPVALVLTNILGHIPDHADARRIVAELVAALAPGSHLVLADSTTDGGRFDAAVSMWNQAGSLPYVLRTRDQLAQLFDGLELLEPGFGPCGLWRPEEGGIGTPVAVDLFGAVGRKS
ncbi:SAM-dependent methyltransferase [Pseudonocardia sp. MH-G8]|uniref:SAM-dependent methyltransferase n=1 Tax=Pseudonocardia sp. MH-G8 TaxID=1854588 RepID=UPI000BA03047|nr:SAM-dependent methyltransferase [Pseudonocardia sp. MH-G8]OZM81235.1 S-adenosyl methyltransferase [Pseudonocardia sp. MH-G8]